MIIKFILTHCKVAAHEHIKTYNMNCMNWITMYYVTMTITHSRNLSYRPTLKSNHGNPIKTVKISLLDCTFKGAKTEETRRMATANKTCVSGKN